MTGKRDAAKVRNLCAIVASGSANLLLSPLTAGLASEVLASLEPQEVPELTERKIVQLCATATENTSRTQCNWLLFALCDDQSVWAMPSGQCKWERLETIPQGDEEVQE